MPHSSGGGSHGGGSHGGSHGGGSRNSHRTRNSYFPGSTRYVYYTNHRPTYIYANYEVGKKPSPLSFLILLFYIPFLFGAFTLFQTSFHYPSKLVSDYDTSIVIQDELGVIDNEAGLRQSLTAFYNETGITPAVYTVYDEDWVPYYSSLENYAYDLYVNSFYDEKHWLIVYSEPSTQSSSFHDWSWEGMQGDDTDPIITEGLANEFTTNLHKYFSQDSLYSVDGAIIKAFDEIRPKAMGFSIDLENLFFGIILAIFIIFHAMGMVFTPYREAKKYQNAVKCPDEVKEAVCDYCGGIYIIGTCISCPHCGAPLKPHNYSYDDPF